MTAGTSPAHAVSAGLGSLSRTLFLPPGGCRVHRFAGSKSPVGALLWLVELLLVNRAAVMGGL